MSEFQYPEAYQNLPAEQLNLERGVTKRGWMLKKSGRNKIPFTPLSNYDKRFFILLKGWVYYYKDLSSKSPQGAFSLQGYSNRVITAEEERCTAIPYVFKVYPKSADGRTYYFAPETEVEMKSWKECFKQEIEKYNITANNLRMSRSLPEKRPGNSPGSPNGPTPMGHLGDTKRPNSFSDKTKTNFHHGKVTSNSVTSSQSTSSSGSMQSLPIDDVASPRPPDHVFTAEDEGYYEKFDTAPDPYPQPLPPPRPDTLSCDFYEPVSTQHPFPDKHNHSHNFPFQGFTKQRLEKKSSCPTEQAPQPPTNKSESLQQSKGFTHNPLFSNKPTNNLPNRPKLNLFQRDHAPFFSRSQTNNFSQTNQRFSNGIVSDDQPNYEQPDLPTSPNMIKRPLPSFNDAIDWEMTSRTMLPPTPGQGKPPPVLSRDIGGLVPSVYEDLEGGMYQDTEEHVQQSTMSPLRTPGGFNLISATTKQVTSRIAKKPLPPTTPTSEAKVAPTLPTKPRSQTEFLQTSGSPPTVAEKRETGRNFQLPAKPLTPIKPASPKPTPAKPTLPKPAVKPDKPQKPAAQKPPTAMKPRSQSKPSPCSNGTSSGNTVNSVSARGQMFEGLKQRSETAKPSTDEPNSTVSARARMFEGSKNPMKPPTGLKPTQPVSYRR